MQKRVYILILSLRHVTGLKTKPSKEETLDTDDSSSTSSCSPKRITKKSKTKHKSPQQSPKKCRKTTAAVIPPQAAQDCAGDNDVGAGDRLQHCNDDGTSRNDDDEDENIRTRQQRHHRLRGGGGGRVNSAPNSDHKVALNEKGTFRSKRISSRLL